MIHRKLGRTGFDVSEIGYGAWGISGRQWIGASTKDSLAALRAAIEGGIDFIDTALAYGDGISERLVGQVVRETGGRARVATKVPPKNRLWPARPGIGIEDVFPYDYILECAEESLRNLNLEAIDLLQLHVWNPDWVDRDEWRRAFEVLKQSGKVRAVGVSINDHQPDTGIGIIETGLIDTVQVIYNIFDQSPEVNLFPACRRHNIGVIARVPFDEGSLTGRITAATVFPEGDFRNSYFRGDRKQQVADRVAAILSDLKLTANEALPPVAIRFCLSSPSVSTVIPGMRSLSSVSGNITASGQGPLPSDLLDVLRRHRWERNFYD
ncbi:MAG TPA: aldo/keto reductase [Bryobacteraceae bacterium]|nr:aldo/keto reductase [Bryobacteraceae bacterium]